VTGKAQVLHLPGLYALTSFALCMDYLRAAKPKIMRLGFFIAKSDFLHKYLIVDKFRPKVTMNKRKYYIDKRFG